MGLAPLRWLNRASLVGQAAAPSVLATHPGGPSRSWPAQDLRVQDTQVTGSETETERKVTPVLIVGE